MKKLVKSAFLASALLAALSCATGCSVNAAFVRGVEEHTVKSGMLDEYEKYVEDDKVLDPDSKRIRKDSAKGLRKLIEEAKRGD